MKVRLLIALLSAGAAGTPAWASFHLWQMSELFSTPDGRVQAIELVTAADGQHLLTGHEFRAVDTVAGTTNSFFFPANAPDSSTSGKTLLLATPGFADLPGGVTPDFTIPRGFLPVANGDVALVGAVAQQSYSNNLPLDGRQSLNGLGTIGTSMLANYAGDVASLDIPGAGDQKIYWEGLYHAGQGVDPTVEAIPDPAFAANTFAETDYETGQISIRFLTASPAGDGNVSAQVRLFPAGENGNFEVYVPATWETNVTLNSSNQFHNTPPEGSVTLDLWKAVWTVPRAYTGTVFYAPQVLVSAPGGGETDQLHLTRIVDTNAAASGLNGHFWETQAQAFAPQPIGVDYQIAWTSAVPHNFDLVYFNNTNAGLPELEAVPGLHGTPFFDYDYGNGPSHLYTLTENQAVSSIRTRLFFANGGGEVFADAQFYSNVVIDSAQPFHGYPTSGSVTVDVWQTAFYPPAGWSGETVYYASEVTKPVDGAFWLVRNHDGITNGVTVVNNWPTDPQLLYSETAVGRDWAFTPTGPVARAGIRLDCAYHNNTNRDARVENVPTLSGRPFLDVRYADETTTFYLLTDSPANVAPGDNLEVQIRIDYDHPDTGFNAQFYPMSFVKNITLDPGAPFHGLPTNGTKVVDLWKYDWPHPADTNGVPLTNALQIFYAPIIRTTFGPDQYETGAYALVADSASPAASSHPVDPQYAVTGNNPVGIDFSYAHAWTLQDDTDGDGLSDAAELALGTNPYVADSDGDGASDGDEVGAGTVATNSASVFAVATVASEAEAFDLEWYAVTGRSYAVQCATGLMPPDNTFTNVKSGITVPVSGVATSSLPGGAGPRFYRIRIEP